MKPDAVTDDAGHVPFEGETSHSLVALGLTSSSCPIPDLLPIAQQPGWSFCQLGCMLLNTCHLISLGEESEDSQPSSDFPGLLPSKALHTPEMLFLHVSLACAEGTAWTPTQDQGCWWRWLSSLWGLGLLPITVPSPTQLMPNNSRWLAGPSPMSQSGTTPQAVPAARIPEAFIGTV